MALIYSLQKIINTFEDLAESHLEIDSFGYGFEFDIDTQKQKNQKYRQMWVQPLTTQVILGRSNVINDRRFRIWVYDLLRNDDLNDISVWNQTEAILIDIIREFSFSSRDYKVANSPLLVPIGDRFGESVWGYYTELSIQTAEIVGNCDIPLSGITTTTTTTIPPTPCDNWIVFGGVWGDGRNWIDTCNWTD